jgi:hypothetical protein
VKSIDKAIFICGFVVFAGYLVVKSVHVFPKTVTYFPVGLFGGMAVVFQLLAMTAIVCMLTVRLVAKLYGCTRSKLIVLLVMLLGFPLGVYVIYRTACLLMQYD